MLRLPSSRRSISRRWARRPRLKLSGPYAPPSSGWTVLAKKHANRSCNRVSSCAAVPDQQDRQGRA